MPDLTITATNVSAGTNATIGTGTAGATITAGKVLYKDLSDANKYKLADADVSASAVVAGIALHGAVSAQPIDFVKAGDLKLRGGVTKGRVYVLSPTAGGVQTATEILTGQYVSILGVGTATDTISVKVQNSGVQK